MKSQTKNKQASQFRKIEIHRKLENIKFKFKFTENQLIKIISEKSKYFWKKFWKIKRFFALEQPRRKSKQKEKSCEY